ncbi:hypothetical protein AB0D45_33605 [Streptomyces sp. NPDC048352]|uniref:hypothetical protein n=1 Tax=Streptomyces sp. NPDC048352 TaxID=3154718 RepID=UPI0034414747
MRLTADGTTPVPRAVLARHLETDDGHAFEPAGPLFLFAGDRIASEGGALVVLRADGRRLTAAGGWATRCRGRAATGRPADYCQP